MKISVLKLINFVLLALGLVETYISIQNSAPENVSFTFWSILGVVFGFYCLIKLDIFSFTLWSEVIVLTISVLLNVFFVIIIVFIGEHTLEMRILYVFVFAIVLLLGLLEEKTETDS